MSGLEIPAPEVGAGADAYQVACTALKLRSMLSGPGDEKSAHRASMPLCEPARHAVTLHRISGQLHRLDERRCNEDLTCKACGGDGVETLEPGHLDRPGDTCTKCAGEGSTIGRRVERLRKQVRDIADHYGLVAYFQTDPRGCSLHLFESRVYETWTAEHLREQWIDCNYNRGHAVVRLGR
jgi:hypothetical protein